MNFNEREKLAELAGVIARAFSNDSTNSTPTAAPLLGGAVNASAQTPLLGGSPTGRSAGLGAAPLVVPSKEKEAQETAAHTLNTVLNFQDPSELNSFADAIFNMEALKNRHWFGNPKLPVLYSASPAARIIAGAIDVAYTGGIKPLVGDSNQDGKWDWDFGAVAYNGLNNLFETLDVFANPVKGAVIEGFNMSGSTEGLNAAQGFSRGLGMGSEGRKQYDYNVHTGKGKFIDMVANFGLELVSDPLNYVSLGASSVGKLAGRKGAQLILKETAQAASKSVGSRILKAAAQNIDDAALIVKETFGVKASDDFLKAADAGVLDEFVEGLTKNLDKEFASSTQFRQIVRRAAKKSMYEGTDLGESIASVTKRQLTSAFDGTVWKTFGKAGPAKKTLASEIVGIVPDIAKTISLENTNQIMKSMNILYNLSEDAQKGLLKSVIYTSPAGLGLVAGKYGVTKLWAKYGSTMFLKARLMKQFKAKDFSNTEKVLSAEAYLKSISAEGQGAVADIPDDILYTTMRMSAASELDELLAIRAKFSDARIAASEIEAHIQRKYGKSVLEYLVMIKRAVENVPLSTESKALYEQHVLQIVALMDDVTTQAASYGADTTLRTMKSDLKAFTTNVDVAKENVRALINTAMAKFPADTDASFVLLRRTLPEEDIRVTQKAIQEILEDPRMQKYINESPVLKEFKTPDLFAATVGDLQELMKALDELPGAFRKELAPTLRSLKATVNGIKYKRDVSEFLARDPQVELGRFLERLEEADPVLRKALLDSGALVALEKDIQYSFRAPVEGFINEFDKLMNNTLGVTLPKALTRQFKDIVSQTDARVAVEALQDFTDELDTYVREMFSLTTQGDGIAATIAKQSATLRMLHQGMEDIIENGFAKSYPNLAKVDSEFVGYVAKSTQFAATQRLMHVEAVEKGVEYLRSIEGVHDMEFLLSAAKDLESSQAVHLEQLVKEVQMYASNHRLVTQFQLRVLNNPKLNQDSMVIGAFFDALATYSRDSYKSIADHAPEVLEDIFKRMEGYVNGIPIKDRNRLEDVFYRLYGNDEDDLTKSLAQYSRTDLKFHDATDDVIASMLVAEKQNPALKGHMFGLDIETSESGHVLQIAYYVDGKMHNYRILTSEENLFAKEDVVRKLSGLGEGHSYAEHFAEYKKNMLNPEGAIDERTAIQYFLKDYRAKMLADPEMRLVGHNLRDSDELILNKRIAALKIPNTLFGNKMFRDQTRFDTFLEAIKGTKHLDFDTAPELKALFSAEAMLYFKQRALEISYYDIGNRPLFEQTGGSLAAKLYELAREMDSIGLRNEDMLRYMGVGLIEELSSIKQANVQAQMWMFGKNGIPEVGNLIGVPGAKNASQLVNDLGITYSVVGSKILVDFPTANLYFKKEYVDNYVMEATEFGRKIHRLYDRLGDVETLLTGKSEEVAKLFRHLKASLPVTTSARNLALRSLELSSSLKTNVAMTLELLWDIRSRITIPEGVKIEDALHGMLDRIANPEVVDMFVKRYPLLEQKYTSLAKGQVDLNKAVRMSTARIEAELTLKAFEGRRNFFDMAEDGVAQYYRFNQKYNLIFADRLIQRGQEMWDAIARAAAKDTPDNPAFAKALYDYGDARFRNAASYVLSLQGQDLLAHLKYLASGIVVIKFQDWNDPKLVEQAARFVEANKELGLILEWNGPELIIGIGEDTLDVPRSALKEPPIEQLTVPEGLGDEVLDELRKTTALNYELKDALRRLAKVEGDLNIAPYAAQSTGALFSSEAYNGLVAGLPKSVQNKLKLPETGFDMFSFDYSNLASPRLRRLSDPYASQSIAHIYSNVMETFIGYIDTGVKSRMMLTSESSLNRFSNLFESVPDNAEVLRILKANETYRILIAENADTPFGYRVRQLYANNEADIELLRHSDAILTDHNTHRMLRNMLNRGEISSKFVRIMNNIIISPSKAAALSSVGFIVRNIIDSNLKNLAELESPAEIPEYTRHTFEALRWFHIYEQDLKTILTISDEHINELRLLKDADIETWGPNKASIDAYFAGLDQLARFLNTKTGKLVELPKETLDALKATLTPKQLHTIAEVAAERTKRRDMFNLIHTYVAQGPSAGVVMAQQDLLDVALAKRALKTGKKLSWDEKVKQFAWTNGYTRFFMNTQSAIEQAVRFSKFTWDLKQGSTVGEAMHNVIMTHFDYATKSSAMLYLETILPFATFTIANAEYWARLMSKRGWVFGALRDVYAATMTPSEYSQYEVQNNKALQYAMLNGTIPLSYEGFGLKVNPSYMDVFNMLLSPKEALTQRISKAVSIPIEVFVSALMGTLSFDEAFLKKVLSGSPTLGIVAQRYWVSKEWKLLGSAWKAYLRSENEFEEAAVLALPSLFTNMDRVYYFNYPSSNEVWRTSDFDTYKEQLEKGAVPVITNQQGREIEERVKKYFYYGQKEYSTYDPASYEKHIRNGATDVPTAPMVFYYGDKEYTTYKQAVYDRNIAKGATAKPGQKKTSVSFRTTVGYTRRSSDKYASGMVYRGKGHNARPFGQALNLSFLAPAVWRLVYAAGGNDRFKARLTKPTAKNLQYRIRMGWRYWR